MSKTKVTRSLGKMEIWEPPDKSFSKHVLMEGQGELVNDGSVCIVDLHFINPTEVDESALGGYKFGDDIEVTVGEGDTKLSEHLDAILLSMKEGERCYIKSKLDSSGNIVKDLELNKHAGLKFNVHLKSLSRSAESAELEQDERLERAQHHKDLGTTLFKEGRIEFAVKRYQKALRYILDMEPVGVLPESLVKQHRTLRCQCYLNLAACFSKDEKHEEVIEHCTKALEMEQDNVKGLFRRGNAHVQLNQYKEAKEDLNRALAAEPENKAVMNLLKTIDVKLAKEKQMYQKMFS